MISPTLRELLRPAMFAPKMLWFVLTASILIYGVLAHLLAQQSDGTTAVDPAIRLAISMTAIAAGTASLLVPRFLLSDERVRRTLQPPVNSEEFASIPGSDAIDENRLNQVRQLSDSEQKMLRLPALLFTPFILRLVLNESIAISGLVLSLLSHSLTPFLPFAVIAIVLNVIGRPQIDPVLERAARLVH